MSVLIKGMEKPEHCGYCRFRYDGICHALQKTQYSMNECPLVVIDDAGLNDTISRQAAIDALNDVSKHYTDKGREWHPHVDFMVDAIKTLPSAVKHGRWTRLGDNSYKCSECGEVSCCFANYCPDCGARMDGEENG